MAFKDQLRKYKLGTGMAQSSSEELQNLSGQAERPIAPSNPLESSVIGASPDVAKMAGTPAQKTSALRVAIQQSKNLGDVNRTAQNRQQLTGAEQEAQQKGQTAKNLSGLNSRVQALTGSMLQTAQSGTTAQMTVDPTKLQAFAPEAQTEAQGLLQKLGTNQASNQDILRLNQLMGKTSIADQLNADQLKSNFLSAGTAAGQSLAQATADQISVNDIDPTTLGFADMNELASTLGIPPEELAGLSLKDLQDQSQKLFQEEFDKVNTLEARANDINLGPAERAEARKELKDAGATGVRQSEAGIDKLADQVANADTVNFAGSDMKVQDVLSDEYLSGLAAHYVDSDPNDPFREELKASEPELAKWLDDNQEVLKQATADLDADVKTFSDLQFQNQKLKSSPDLPDMDDGLMKAILPDWGELRADVYNIDEVPALKLMQDSSIPQVQRANVRNSFDQFNQAAPQLVGQLARLSPQQLDQLGAMSGSGNTKWQAVTSYLKDVSNVNGVTAEQPDTIGSFFLGAGKGFNDLMQTSKAVQSRARSGLFGNSPINDEMTNVLQTGDPAQIDQYLKGKFAQPQNIADLVNTTPTSASQSGQLANTYAQQTNELYDLTSKYFDVDSTLGPEDTADLARKNPLGLEKVYTSQLLSKMSPAAQKSAQKDFNTGYTPEYNQKLQDSKLFTIEKSASLANKKPGSLGTEDILKLDGTLNQMRSELKAMSQKKNPLQYKFLNDQIKSLGDKVNAHYDKWKEDALSTIALGNNKDAVKQITQILDSGAPGATGVARQVAKAMGLNDEKMLRKVAETMGKKNMGYLQSLQSLDLAGNFINEATKYVDKLAGGSSQKKATETAGAVGRKVSNVASEATGGAIGGDDDGCFMWGERFSLADGSDKMVQDIMPGDIMLYGGRVFCTAQFICNEMYEYNLIKVAGCHAVLEGDKWIRVRDSKTAKRIPEYDGAMVYVTWNENHRMVHANGTVFADYAETDGANIRIAEMKNLTELNETPYYVV